jgi:hypothetical protein
VQETAVFVVLADVKLVKAVEFVEVVVDDDVATDDIDKEALESR